MSVWQYEYLKLQAHQNDPSVWCRDYADKQKAKTLEMVGKIDLKEYLSCGTCKHKSSCGFQGWKNDCQFYEGL